MFVDRFATTGKVQNVFGEPIEAHGKTIIPENYPSSIGLQPGGHDLAGVTDLDFRRFDDVTRLKPRRGFARDEDLGTRCLYGVQHARLDLVRARDGVVTGCQRRIRLKRNTEMIGRLGHECRRPQQGAARIADVQGEDISLFAAQSI